MKSSILSLVRENIKAMKAYSSARSLYTSGILLDANESPYSLVGNQDGLNRYPDGSNKALREKIAQIYEIGLENLALGNGSDEIIDLLVRIFCNPAKESIMILPPTFGMYRVAANMNDIGIEEFTHPEFFQWEKNVLPLSLRVPEILESIHPGIKILFICNPNNPTGSTFNRMDILELVEKSPCIVVVDEAYGDFMKEESLVSEIGNFSNLVILKTMSKAYALAGIRLGMAISSSEIIELIQKVKLPYNINLLTSGIFLDQPDFSEKVKGNIQQILLEKEMLQNSLREHPLIQCLIPSEGNFFLARFHESEKVFEELVNRGIIVRKVDPKFGLESCLRISVGTPEENQLLIEALHQIHASHLS